MREILIQNFNQYEKYNFNNLSTVIFLWFSQRQNNWRDGHVELDSIPLTAYEYKERGKRKSANGDKQGAIDDYTRAIMVEPTYDTAYHNRGVVRADIGYYKDAILDYTKAIEINPHFAASYFFSC